MYESFERKISEAEIDLLKRRSESIPKPSLSRFACRSVALLVFSIGLYLASRLFWQAITADAAVGIVFLIAEFCLFAFEMDLRQSRRKSAKRVRSAIANGTVHVERVESTAALKFAEHSDEGPTYFFDVGDGKVFCLRGQEAYVIEDPPSARFELISIPRWRMIDVVTHGDAIQDFHVIDNYDHSQIPGHEGLLDPSFADLRSRFVPSAAS
jgi:hypothetical protein